MKKPTISKSYHLQNLKCGSCQRRIEQVLIKIDGIENIKFAGNTIILDISEKFNDIQVKKTLSKLGYPAAGTSNSLIQKSKSFISCAIGKTHS